MEIKPVYIHSRMENFHAQGNNATAEFINYKLRSNFNSKLQSRIKALEGKRKIIESEIPNFLKITRQAILKKNINNEYSYTSLMINIYDTIKKFRIDNQVFFQNNKNGVLIIDKTNESGNELVKQLKLLADYVNTLKIIYPVGTDILAEMEKYDFFKFFNPLNTEKTYQLSAEEFANIFIPNISGGFYTWINNNKGAIWGETAIAKSLDEIRTIAGKTNNITVEAEKFYDNKTLSDIQIKLKGIQSNTKNININIESKLYGTGSKKSSTTSGTIGKEYSTYLDDLFSNDNDYYNLLNTIILNTRTLESFTGNGTNHNVKKKRLWGPIPDAFPSKMNSKFNVTSNITDLFNSIAAYIAIGEHFRRTESTRIADLVVFSGNVYWYVDYFKIIYNFIQSEQWTKFVSLPSFNNKINLINGNDFSKLYSTKSTIQVMQTLKENPNAYTRNWWNENEWEDLVTSNPDFIKQFNKILKNFNLIKITHSLWSVPWRLIDV